MARTIKNKNVVYTGKVGAKMKPRKGPTSSNRASKVMFKCVGGPLHGVDLCLQMDGGTLPIQMKGQFGHYARMERGHLLDWHPANRAMELAA